MPELPEVETIRRALVPVIAGRMLAEFKIADPLWCDPRDPRAIEETFVGRTIATLSRRGKYLIASTTDDHHLVMHLRMTGTLLVDPPADVRYSRVRFAFDNGHQLHFCDPRRFGTGLHLLGEQALVEYLDARLGIEPLLDGALDGPKLSALARGRKATIKAFLLDQKKVAGIGNIYADEALFRARIHPLRAAGRLTAAQYAALAVAVRDALSAGLAAGGASIDDFRHPNGVQGAFQNDFQIHLRAGEPCIACGREVRKIVAAGRGTYVCEHCQPRPRPRK